jgi:NEDD4-binding protein 2
MKKLKIMRGVPGSGKSYLANKILEDNRKNNIPSIICSTDDFFYKNGEYQFDRNKLHIYHNRNFRRVFMMMEDECECIIVDNTNIKWDVIRKYAALALVFGYEVEFLEPQTEWRNSPVELFNRNQHSVPAADIARMLSQYELNSSIEEKFKRLKNAYQWSQT